MRTRVAAVCAIAGALGLGCGGARTSSTESIGPAAGSNITVYAEVSSAVDGDTCRAAAFPIRLPSVYEVLDSVAFHTSVADSMRAAPDVMLAIRFGSRGLPERVSVLDTTVASSERARIEGLVRSAIRPQSHGGVWGLRLTVYTGEPAMAAVERSLFCPPSPIGPATATATTTAVMSAGELADLERAGHSASASSWA